MSLLRAFIAHEALTQYRAARFRVIALAYVALAIAPAVLMAVVARNAAYVIGAPAFAASLRMLQPLLTTLLAIALSIDAITRERDEGSFTVVSLAPLSASGYVLRRWLALAAVALPVTLVPPLLAAALSTYANGLLPELAPFAWTFFCTWLLYIAPLLVVMTAAMLALGTITGRTVLALLAFGALATFGHGALQDVLALSRMSLDGAGDWIGLDGLRIQELIWTARGYWSVGVPSDAGYPLAAELDDLLPRALLLAALAALLLGIAPAFLRRTKRDLRPWRIRETHPLRTLLRTVNRLREEYTPDAGRQPVDVLVALVALLCAGAAVTTLLARESRFMQLAAQRFEAEEASEPREMSVALVPRSIRIEGDAGERVRTRTRIVFENRGSAPLSHLAFALNPMLQVATLDGRITRRWERVGLDLPTPMQPGETRTLTFDVHGTPAGVELALNGGGPFAGRYRRWLRATEAIELSDLSRSRLVPAATPQRMLLNATDVAPVPRYTPWVRSQEPPERGEADLTAFVEEAVLPESDVAIALRVPARFTVADSCGTIASDGRLASRCRFALAAYAVAGAELAAMRLRADATLLHLASHEQLAATHAPALSEAIARVEEGWPGLSLGRSVFFERPTAPREEARAGFLSLDVRLRSSGALQLVPEALFIRRQPMDSGRIAASLLASTLRSRRHVAESEQFLFARLFDELAQTRLAGGQRSAVMPPTGRPSTEPLLRLGTGRGGSDRLRAVLVDLEYRVGADRLVEGVNDFLARPGRGDAKELLDAISRRGDVDLGNVYRDYFAGDALPRLTLHGVAFRQEGARWSVTGTVRNDGTGEAYCPVVLRTELGAVRTTVRVGSGESVPFALATQNTPRTLQLDPEKVCYRHAAVGLVDTLDYRGDSRGGV